jgi:hypothetical protein
MREQTYSYGSWYGDNGLRRIGRSWAGFRSMLLAPNITEHACEDGIAVGHRIVRVRLGK